jgi:hypothetical protein
LCVRLYPWSNGPDDCDTQARKSYESVPWKAMGTVASITGPRLSAAIIDLVLGVSTGGHTLFDRHGQPRPIQAA